MIELAVRQMNNLELGGQRILVKKNEKRPAEPRNAPSEEPGCDIADRIEKNIGNMAQNFANVINHQEGAQAVSNQNNSPYSSVLFFVCFLLFACFFCSYVRRV